MCYAKLCYYQMDSKTNYDDLVNDDQPNILDGCVKKIPLMSLKTSLWGVEKWKGSKNMYTSKNLFTWKICTSPFYLILSIA